MRGAVSGLYAGPLRLLAMEVYDTCNAEGLYCNLVTGAWGGVGRGGRLGKRVDGGRVALGPMSQQHPPPPPPPAGQERREVPGAAHTACTVEMVNMKARVDVAVIDEIQMIGDESRGWAWTRALMGVPANEVHLCGDGSGGTAGGNGPG